MKPRVVRLAASCFGVECWALVLGPGVPCIRFDDWAEAVRFALRLRWRA